MSRNGKVIVAMSGGVDSSVAACLLKEQGYECIGVFMRVGTPHDAAGADDRTCTTNACGDTAPAIGKEGPAIATAISGSSHNESKTIAPEPRQAHPRRLRHGCCSSTDAMDARAVAGRLGIPFYALNYEREFERIIDYFVGEYGQARTPNPCVMCNIHLKFGKLLTFADLMDAPLVATGHYARILSREELGPHPAIGEAQNAFLARGTNRDKDQSYVLFGIRREDLPRCLFPIGRIDNKPEVRRLAAGLGLRVHDKPDSQEICFVPDNDYRELIRSRRPELLAPGEMRHEDGRVLGRHEGVAAYTIGQRRGLGVALGAPAYVSRLNVLDNTVTLGTREDLLRGELTADRVNWLIDPTAFETLARERRALVGRYGFEVKIRHMHAPAAADVDVTPDGDLSIRFETPQSAITPGQAAVVYAGDIAIAGGWIVSKVNDTPVSAGR